MMIKRQVLLWGVFFLLLSGCGKPDRGTIPVSVEIIYENKPVAEASVTILNDEGKYAVGITDAKGTAKLWTFEKNDGAMPGQYKVAVDKHTTVFPSAPASPAEEANYKPVEPKNTYIVPQKFADAKTSGLTLEVVKGQKNHFVFKL